MNRKLSFTNQPRAGNPDANPRARPSAFTLIELLVVIAVIGILASLILAVSGSAALKMRLNRVKAELSQYETAIEAYKVKFGNYPPDNVKTRDANGQPLIIDPNVNQLFYELTGTTTSNGVYVSALDQENILPRVVSRVFQIQGFLNVGEEGQPKDFLPSLKPSQRSAYVTNPTVRLLTVSVPWPLNGKNPPIPNVPQLNPVRYVSSKPTNNPTTFDLWAEVPIGKKVYQLGNWNEYVPTLTTKQP
ncbi:MAG: type II secretion system protein [Limisphaerales bacterium]